MAYKGFDLTGKVSLITGGNGGIGFGMADALAEAGAGVCIWGTNASKNAASVEKLKRHGGKVHAQIVDVADEAAVEAAFAETLKVMGKVDNCVANSGVSGRGSKGFADITAAEWRRVLSVNLDGVFFTFRAAVRHMIERGEGGSLVAMASTAAIEGAARNEHYAASKGGVVSMVRALAVELARYKITANSILPGWIETAMTANAFNNEKFAGNVKPRIPVRRWGVEEDFGPVAVYLASDATKYTTGQSIVIDGGYTLF
ncbi:SDR family NAD(P)-dependent oxidoreductase [Reyranella sp. CPCC 100927]|uniref:SDR family NAD(P)-dependent oxidoreductase n=1 Tax=Reyranella sp. CPCC 100927 TaxID=2599616 RepID=UPI0011B58AA7|nr:SDR family NAD(P)-dependent oxidoreductase [Reyranella sp. CPCC 100927]TWT15775.1 SDR family oxidoreductase [Reyranella sp. CPCC 100927]